MKIRFILFSLLIMCWASLGVAASAQSDAPAPLLQALALVPDNVAARTGLLGYSDFRAGTLTRPGAIQPETWDEFLTPDEENALGVSLWLNSLPFSGYGASRFLLSGGVQMKTVMGFDFFDLDQAVTFGNPPAAGDIYIGAFEADKIDTALIGQGFVAAENDYNLREWCHPEGCDQGMMVDMKGMNVANPFGGQIGRKQPIFLTETNNALLSSQDHTLANAMARVAVGEDDSLAQADDYLTAAHVLTQTPDSWLRQAYFVNPSETMTFGDSLIMGLDLTKMTQAQIDQLQTDLTPEKIAEQYGVVPYYALMVIGDLAIGDPTQADFAEMGKQVATLTLIYSNPEDAQQAVDAFALRFDTLNSLTYRRSYQELFTERGTEITSEVIEDAETGMAAAHFTFTYALPSSKPDDVGIIVQSGIVYQLMLSLIYSRDLLIVAVN